ncbi:conserved hypothetical protein [Ricinus communis]|uniref:VAN3-binding protein-like auxin canalisation domain-containing protein n=1 Tax=Ricinus communis TaxID=3988 RepID=B9S1X0_RICCO|nr:conserved hypothetical protein [Ricinus communis]
MNLKRIKEWLRQKSLAGVFMKWRRGEKKKEEVRLLTAKIHAALSVAQLAAAIAGFAATSMEISKDIHNEDLKTSNVVAYATALLASACAEAAESVGATRAHVASAVNSGLATQSPADMITLTASAATSLRGSETLKSRATSANKEPVKLAAKLLIRNPSGQKVLRSVSIYLGRRQLMLRLEKKYLGVITTSKECKI